MSRIGKRPVAIPSGVTAEIGEGTLSVRGPKGTLTLGLREEISYAVDGETMPAERYRNVTAPELVDVGLSAETKYAYVVRAANGSGTGPASDRLDLKTNLKTPINLTAAVTIRATLRQGRLVMAGAASPTPPF